MDLPFRFFRHRVVRILALAVPCALALALGVLQYGWIRQAAVTEEQRRVEEEQRRAESALLDVRRAVEGSFEGLRLAVSLQRTAMGLGGASAEVIAGQALSAWFQQAAFPSLVRGVWLVSDAGSRPRAVRVALGPTGATTRSEVPLTGLPPALRSAARFPGESTEARATVDQLRTSLGNQGFVLVWAALGPRSNSFAALEVDTAAYLTAVLPASLKRTAYTATVHPASERPPRARGKRLIVSVPNVWYASLFQELPDTAPGFLPGAPGFDAAPEDSVGFVSIEYAETARPGGTRSWLIFNLAASMGILAVLLAALVGALLLFARMREMRTAELEFVASVGHELRLPVTVIRVIGDNLSAGVVRDQPRLAKYGEQLRRQTGRLSSMVESLLLSAGLQQGTRPELSRFRPYEGAARVAEELATLLEEHGVTVSVDGPETEIEGDENGFSLVLRNLLLNAVLHASPAEEEPRVGIRVSFDPPMLRLEVSDNGPGIPKKEQRAVFEPFGRTSRSLSEQRPGSGLGLHIAKRITRLNEGGLSVSSPYRDAGGVLRAGCRFTATLKYQETGGA